MRKTKRVLRIAALGLALAATGCVQGDAVKREAGNWKTDRKLVKFEFPGMSPEERSAMVEMMSNTPSMNRCLTQEQVEKEGPLPELIGKTAAGEAQCTWSKMGIAKGKVDIAGACAIGDQAFDLTVTGTAAADKTDVIVAMNGKTPVGQIVFSVTDVRTGPCAADAAKGT
jgi:hypothetical protein